eukprot:gene469-10145_t
MDEPPPLILQTEAFNLYITYSYALFGLGGFLVNIAMLIVLRRDKRSESTFNKTMASLGIANMLIGLIFSTAGFLMVSKYENDSFFMALWYVKECVLSVSIFHLVFIAIQRLTAVLFPLRFKVLFTPKMAAILLVAVWIVSILFLVCVMLPITNANLDLPSFPPIAYATLLTGIVLLMCYIAMLYRLLHLKRFRFESSNADQRSILSFRLFFNSFGVTLVFILLAFPFAVSVIENNKLRHWSTLFATFFAIKTMADPTVYFFISKCSCERVTRRVRNGQSGSSSKVTEEDIVTPRQVSNQTTHL